MIRNREFKQTSTYWTTMKQWFIVMKWKTVIFTSEVINEEKMNKNVKKKLRKKNLIQEDFVMFD